MKTENISDALGMLDEEMLEHALMVRKKTGRKAEKKECGGRRERKAGRIKYAFAACLCLVALSAAAILFVVFRDPEKSLHQDGSCPGSLLAEAPQESGQPQDEEEYQPPESGEVENPEEFVEVSSLLAAGSHASVTEMQMEYAKVPIAQYMGFYEKMESADREALAAAMGGGLDGMGEWSRISGHTDLQYLIRKNGQEYSLWKFRYFESDEYPYSDVLELVYQIFSAEDIREIEISPARMDNTEEGIRIQEMVGTHVVTDRKALESIYQVLSSMTCYGSDRWDLIDYGNMEAAEDGAMESHDAVRLGRYLTVTTDYGNEIDGLKYTAVSDMFYEFSGIAYNPLTGEQAESVWAIIGMTEDRTEGRDENGVDNGEHAQNLEEPAADSEKLLCEIANRDASLEEITQLQERVSSAMIAHELPFVISSAVYENPYRLHIVVTSDAESDIEKLRMLDTLGGVLEIEYTAENNNVLMLE